MQQSGAHAHGELGHPHAARLGDEKVAQLMDKDQYSESKNGQNDIHYAIVSLT